MSTRKVYEATRSIQRVKGGTTRHPNRKDYYKAALRKHKLSRTIRGSESYNFYWLKTFQCHSKPYMQITWQVYAISELPCASVLKRVFAQNLSYEDELYFHESESSGGTHFYMNGFARRLVLTQRQNSTGKWPIMISGLLLMLMFKYYFTVRIRQWRRHFFVWATLEFNSSFCYSPANQNKRDQWVHDSRHSQKPAYDMKNWDSTTNSPASVSDSEIARFLNISSDTGNSANQVSFSKTSHIFGKRISCFHVKL